MTIDHDCLANRLKVARVNSGLTQDQAARDLELPRTAIVQIEAGNRSVNTLELSKFAALYRRTIASFFESTSEESEEDALISLFRAAHSYVEELPWKDEVARYLGICRAGVELEKLLNRSTHIGPPSYDLPHPQSVMEAVEQGTFVADEERRRLSLGYGSISDICDLINGQHIWASGAKLPNEMSGLFLQHSSIGLFILVNFDHPRARKRFSYAHEYAHALLDRQKPATVSLDCDRKSIFEVRANSFAASLLLPRNGVLEFLRSHSKAAHSVHEQPIYDPAAEKGKDEIRASRRNPSRSQTLSYEDVAALAHHFGVSYQAALFRLKGLSIIVEGEFTLLRDKEDLGKRYLEMLQLLVDLDGYDNHKPERELVSQVIHLALEAYRRASISKGKLRELSQLLGVSSRELLVLAEGA